MKLFQIQWYDDNRDHDEIFVLEETEKKAIVLLKETLEEWGFLVKGIRAVQEIRLDQPKVL